MKMHVYLSVVGSVLLLGFVLTYFRDKDKNGMNAYFSHVESPHRFQKLGAHFAEKTRTGPIAEWQVYGGLGDAVMADGIDSEGRQIIKCVFDKITGRPWSILRVVWKDVDLSDVPKNNPRQIAEWWLNRVMTQEEGKWRWVRDGKPSPYRYLSMWRCADYDASLSVNTKSGQLIALRVNLPNSLPGR